ncbi:MAG: hypothetical protein PHI93_12505 [Kiritimatiellae bacterium]|nr:hypothetical protein [Kiritimatiellia bacterium]
MTEIYPDGLLPADVHPFSKYLLGFGLQPEQVAVIAKHLGDDLGMRLDETRSEKTFRWAIDIPRDLPDREKLSVGDTVDITVSDRGAVRISGGSLPPGMRLEKHSGKLVGTLTHSGLYSVTLTIGPAVKYDPLGSAGGPNDPGVWIPFEQPRQVVPSALSVFPATVDDLSEREKDILLAELLAERDRKTIRGAE